MVFRILQLFARFFVFYHVSISPFILDENRDCLWPLQLQKTEKLKMWANFPYICVFFRQIAIKWAVGKLKLLIPHALYSLKCKISSVAYILDYKICEVQIFVLAWVEELQAIKVNARFFLHQRKYLGKKA